MFNICGVLCVSVLQRGSAGICVCLCTFCIYIYIYIYEFRICYLFFLGWARVLRVDMGSIVLG